MATVHVDARDGLTAELLLGGLVAAGASLEAVESAVSTLGGGAVRLAVAHVQRAGRPATVARVHAPDRTPDVPTWDRARAVLDFAAVPDPVRDTAVAAMSGLIQAEAAVAGASVEDLDLSAVGTLDAMALTIAVCAAVHDLGADEVVAGPVGVATGEVHTPFGTQVLPAPAVARLLAPFTVLPHPAESELTTGLGAALLAALAAPGSHEPPHAPTRTGLGTSPRAPHLGHPPVLRVRLV